MMRVASVSINIGSGTAPMVTSFQNPRLPAHLGPYDRGTGAGFGYGLQVTFVLDGIDPRDVEARRKVAFHVEWQDPLAKKLGQAPVPNIRGKTPSSNDDPNAANIKVQQNDVVIFDGPGPSNPFAVSDAAHYPIRFQGNFVLSLVHRPSSLTIAMAEYFLTVEKQAIAGPVTGTFDPMRLAIATLRTTVVQHGNVTSAPIYSIAQWASNQNQLSLS